MAHIQDQTHALKVAERAVAAIMRHGGTAADGEHADLRSSTTLRDALRSYLATLTPEQQAHLGRARGGPDPDRALADLLELYEGLLPFNGTVLLHPEYLPDAEVVWPDV